MKPSRGMIPMELLIACLSLSFALVGGLGWPPPEGPLYGLLVEKGQSVVWLVLLGTPAAVLAGLGAAEWRRGRHWDVVRLDRSCCHRSWLVGIQGLCWLYGLYLPLAAPWTNLRGIALISVVMMFFCAWSYVENRRVRREIRRETTSFLAPGH